MKRILLALSLISIFSSAHAELLEQTVTVQMKCMDQLPQITKNGTTTVIYKTSSFKTADLIKKIGEGLDKSFSSKARLLYIINKTDIADERAFIIRDNGTDTEVPHTTFSLGFLNHVLKGSPASASKGKLTPTSYSITDVGPANLGIDPVGLPPLIDMVGMLQRTQRIVLSKQFTDPPATLDYFTNSFTGWGSHSLDDLDFPEKRVIQGSFKISPPKIKPSP